MKRAYSEVGEPTMAVKRISVRPGGDGKVPLPFPFELRLLIPSNAAGPIIGLGGKNISRLRQEFNASVLVPDCPGPERVMSIVTSDAETALKIISQIIPTIEEAYSKNLIDVRILVHQSLAGCVIGRGGSKVKELRLRTAAKFKIYGNCCPQSTERVISVLGTREVVMNGIREVVMMIKDTPAKGYFENYDPSNFDEMYAHEYGGFGIPKGAPPVGEGYQGSSAGTASSSSSRDSGKLRYNKGSSEPTQVTIPKQLAGVIIGKGGARIKSVRAKSGAQVTVEDAIPGSDMRVISMEGSTGQIEHAQWLLQQAIREAMRMSQIEDL